MTLRNPSSFAAVALIVLVTSALTGVRSGVLPISVDADSASVAAVVSRYHRALSDGDSAVALSLLANDATILESGDIETRDEYRSHHLPADIEFARAVPSVRGPVRVVIHGDAAWTISTGRTRGSYHSRIIDSQGAELMVMTREQNRWKIRVIHWSSHASRPSR